MSKLALWLREQNDANFIVFRGIDSESDTLPAGPERQYWSESALREEDEKIRAAEDIWRAAATEAARTLMEKYRDTPDEHT